VCAARNAARNGGWGITARCIPARAGAGHGRVRPRGRHGTGAAFPGTADPGARAGAVLGYRGGGPQGATRERHGIPEGVGRGTERRAGEGRPASGAVIFKKLVALRTTRTTRTTLS